MNNYGVMYFLVEKILIYLFLVDKKFSCIVLNEDNNYKGVIKDYFQYKLNVLIFRIIYITHFKYLYSYIQSELRVINILKIVKILIFMFLYLYALDFFIAFIVVLVLMNLFNFVLFFRQWFHYIKLRLKGIRRDILVMINCLEGKDVCRYKLNCLYDENIYVLFPVVISCYWDKDKMKWHPYYISHALAKTGWSVVKKYFSNKKLIGYSLQEDNLLLLKFDKGESELEVSKEALEKLLVSHYDDTSSMWLKKNIKNCLEGYYSIVVFFIEMGQSDNKVYGIYNFSRIRGLINRVRNLENYFKNCKKKIFLMSTSLRRNNFFLYFSVKSLMWFIIFFGETLLVIFYCIYFRYMYTWSNNAMIIQKYIVDVLFLVFLFFCFMWSVCAIYLICLIFVVFVIYFVYDFICCSLYEIYLWFYGKGEKSLEVLFEEDIEEILTFCDDLRGVINVLEEYGSLGGNGRRDRFKIYS